MHTWSQHKKEQLYQHGFFILQVTVNMSLFLNKNTIYSTAKQSQYNFKNQQFISPWQALQSKCHLFTKTLN